MNEESVLVLRTCQNDLTSFGGFKWKESGIVEAPDFIKNNECGNGLHGFLWGEGQGVLADWNSDAKWLVVKVLKEDIVNFECNDKVKFPKCIVVFCGNRKDATDYIIQNGAKGKKVIGACVSSGHRGTSSSGYFGHSTSLDFGHSISGRKGTSISGRHGTSISGEFGQSTSGDYGNSISEDCGISISGNGGYSISKHYGTSISKNKGTSQTGFYGIASSGEHGTLIIHWWDAINLRRKISIAYVGENGIKPNTPYKLDKDGNFMESPTSSNTANHHSYIYQILPPK